jgi:hypothetical protein
MMGSLAARLLSRGGEDFCPAAILPATPNETEPAKAEPMKPRREMDMLFSPPAKGQVQIFQN